MYKRYYDGYGSCRSSSHYGGEVVIPKDGDEDVVLPVENTKTDSVINHNDAQTVIRSEEAPVAEITGHRCNEKGKTGKIFENIGIDDIILLGVILLVLKDSADDPMLIIILAVVFLSGIADKI